MTIDKGKYLTKSPYEADEGKLIGRDPRKMEVTDLVALGGKTSPMKAIRAKCLDCSGASESEVRKCTAYQCVLWPFRMNKNPFFNRLKDLPDEDEQPETAENESRLTPGINFQKRVKLSLD